MTITLCIPTLSRYDLLKRCLESAEAGIIKPDRYLVIDNGGSLDLKLPKLEVVKFGYNLGVAKSWNYFINYTEEVRVICNDDIFFHPETLRNLLAEYEGNQITCTRDLEASSFSLFTIGDELVNTVGLFDESISPGYAYFEDNDYAYRMELLGYQIHRVHNCSCGHFGSATLKNYSSREMEDHHNKFRIAQNNYQKKWGGLPGKEEYKTPYNGVNNE
jgi:GT2 family glycosyltransferase